MDTKKLTKLALLTAVALMLFTVEAQLPPPLPIPGVKLGLANIVTVYVLFRFGARDALAVLLARVLLGSIFAGAAITLLFSLGGGLLCWLALLPLRRIVSRAKSGSAASSARWRTISGSSPSASRYTVRRRRSPTPPRCCSPAWRRGCSPGLPRNSCSGGSTGGSDTAQQARRDHSKIRTMNRK